MCGLTEIERQEFNKNNKPWISYEEWIHHYDKFINNSMRSFIDERLDNEDSKNSQLKSCINDNIYNKEKS